MENRNQQNKQGQNQQNQQQNNKQQNQQENKAKNKRDNLHDPEQNIAAAAKYIRELNTHFQDVPSAERTLFVLASYNGGYFHIRDAMALATKHGQNAHSWAHVRQSQRAKGA